jgi:hypothetical protein
VGLSHSPVITTDGLILCLDAANVRSYPKSGTVWSDLSGNGNNGTLTNGPTFSNANGGNIDFDGTNDYVNISHNASQSFTGNFSIEAIIYPQAGTANCIIQKGSGNDFYQEYWLLNDMRNGVNYVALIMAYSGNGGRTLIKTNAIISLNMYWHITAQVSGNTGTIFINGQQRATAGISSRLQSTADVRIGGRVDGFAYANAKIPMVKLYNRALSADEIKNNYLATKGRFGL